MNSNHVIHKKEVDQLGLLPDRFQKVAKHTLFQRLKKIGQLGVIDRYNGIKVHSRYEHSIGTALLAIKKMKQHTNIDNSIKEKLIFACLCHDLGHGPFSHSLEHFILPKMGIFDFSHEQYSFEIIKQIYRDIGEFPFNIEDMGDILENGGKNGADGIFHLVSNKVFGVDLDRMDYLKRDSELLGVDLNVNFDKLLAGIRFVKEKDDKTSIVLESEAITEMHNFIEKRYLMFKNFYIHPQSDTKELLVSRLLFESNKYLDLGERVRKLESFVTMDDTILEEVKTCYGRNMKLDRLIDKFNKNEGYTYCFEFNLKDNAYQSLKAQELSNFLEKTKREIFSDCIDFIDDIEITYLNNTSFKDVDYQAIKIWDKEKIIPITEYLKENGLKPLEKRTMKILRLFVAESCQKSKVKETLQKYIEAGNRLGVKEVNSKTDMYDLQKDLKEYDLKSN